MRALGSWYQWGGFEGKSQTVIRIDFRSLARHFFLRMAIPAIQHLETRRLSPAVVGLQRWPLDVFAEKWSAFKKSLIKRF